MNEPLTRIGRDLPAETALKPLSDLRQTSSIVGMENDKPVLLGGECEACGKRSFPFRSLCPYCASSNMQDVQLGSEGFLYSFTTIHVSATRATPYTIGYIDLQGNVRTLALIQGNPAHLRPDMKVKLMEDEAVLSFSALETEGGAA